jgi:DNA (cytosine-5)-methyltransferase 1
MPQHQLLAPVARPVTVKQAIDDLPRIRSKLSRGDSVEAWCKAVQAAPSYVKAWRTENESVMIGTMRAFAAAATSTSTGGAFISRVPSN